MYIFNLMVLLNKISRKLGFLCIVFLSILVSAQAQTALQFDGSTSYVEIPYAAANNTAQFTVEFWARLDGGAGTFRAPLSNRNDSPLKGYNFYARTDNTWSFTGGRGVPVWESLPGPAVVINQWTHLAATYDGTWYRFYVNGVLEGSPHQADFSPNTASPMRFGAGNTESTTPNYYFPGAIDEVRIWDYARSSSQINDNKYVNLAVPQTGLVSYYQFDGGSGTSKTGSTAGVLKNTPTTVTGVIPSAPTSISGTSSICAGDSTTLTSTGGSTGVNAIDVWYSGAFDEAFSEGWDTQPYATSQSTINSNNNGILNVTSTGGDPKIDMNSLGSFDPSVYKYINFRYRVVSGSAGAAEIFFLNSTYTSPTGGISESTTLVSDNAWHIGTIDMSLNSSWTIGGNITGWRYDFATQSGATMDIDFIQLGTSPIAGTGTSISVAPIVSTTYSVNRKGPSANTTAIAQLVTVNPLPIPTFTAQPDDIVIDSNITYTTQSGQSNYVWTIPGVLNTDYSISSGGTSSDNTVVLKWLKMGSKAIQINYTNSNNCVGATATSSNSINVRNFGITRNGLKISYPVNSINQYGAIGTGKSLSVYGEIMDTPYSRVASGLIMHLDAGNTASYSGTGNVWNDISGYGNHGTLVNNPLYNSSNGGNLVFNGSNNYINAPLTKTTSCSFSVWAKSTNTNSGNMLFNAGNNGAGPDLFFSGGILSWNTWDSSANPFGSIPATSNDGNWHNYVVVNDAVSNTAKLYYDGVLYGTAVYKDASVSTSLYIGGTTSTYMWNGAIGNFQVHNIALTSLEVDQNFNSLKSRYGL